MTKKRFNTQRRELSRVGIVLLLILFWTSSSSTLAAPPPPPPSVAPMTNQKSDKIVIAHRGASGYLMEHNIPSLALAVGLDSDYIEQELVMTKDDQVIVLREPTLNRVTNVAEIFPGRQRKDGGFYALDFTLAEIKQLHLKEPYPNGIKGEERFPDTNDNLQLTVPSFKEELELIRGLETTLRKTIGIYPEIKQPWLHRKEGKDISLAVIKILKEYGYTRKDAPIFLQCFDPDELQRIRTEILPAHQMEMKLIQLIDDNNGNETKVLEWGEWVNYNYDWMLSKSGLRALSVSVSGIGLDKSMLVDDAGNLVHPALVEDAHSLGLVLHPWSFRREQESIPPYIQQKNNTRGTDFEALLDFFYFKIGVDGVFTDYCGDAVRFLQHHSASATGTERISSPSGTPTAEQETGDSPPAQPPIIPDDTQTPTAAPLPVTMTTDDKPIIAPAPAPMTTPAPPEAKYR